MQLSPQYVAGFVDGEGCITITRAGNGFPRAEVIIANTKVQALRLIQKQYGGRLAPRRTVNPLTKKQLWILTYRNRDVTPILDVVYPYLIVKSEQAWVALCLARYYDEVREGYASDRKGCWGNPIYTDDELAPAIAAMEIIHKMNR